ncbi:LCP family protein required for cell wall assembly [Microbacterium halimionae]|uniref:LCP family protein required for cell wall assembly n=1 Tax=Microbacterium halimionae TaxID=1526413 RepID=A0A7W3JMJ9_9MICO|nr:LCP family protein [Microbacterium halimionae]MBA8815494.1 LCP family protein required for cell wall assembly [Microbacterium halimionae]NII95541.1 LCP family protein required for cell wall assembly [Microbacterium halimionae]
MSRQRSTVARHARLRSPHPAKQALKLVAVAAVVALVAVAGVASYVIYDLSNTVTSKAVALEDEVVQPPTMGAFEGDFSVLIVGTDECEEELQAALGDRCTGADSEGQLNDVNMLMHVSENPRRVSVVSFPRDLMVAVPSCTREDGSTTSAMSKQPLNSVFSVGGLGCVASTISALTDFDIPFAAKVSFGGVVNITDAIGGVEVCIGNNGIRDYYTGIDWEAGMRQVQGLDALQFLRTRHGVGDESDLARIGNQQQYMSRLAHKLRSDEVLADAGALYRLANAAVTNITPSESLTNPLRLVQLALAVKDVPFEDITFVQYPVVDDSENSNKVAPDFASAEVLMTAIAENKSLELNGKAGSNGGVIEVTPTDEPAEPAPEEPTDAASDAPADETVALPGNVNGTSADQETCSAGNGR